MSELLAPAGNIEALDAAIGEGADAVYLGLKSFNARLRSSNFAWNQFEAAVSALHRQNKKIYVTVNTVSEERDLERLYRFLSYLNKIGPDGLIVQDFGVVRMCQEFFPKLELHGSTQMNVESAAGVNLLSKAGLKRVVVARELGLEEIKYIKSHTNAELEIFVHGALCVSESGLCLFSSFLGGKSANRGMCTQACRRFYTVDSEANGEQQGYYFSPCDLQLIEQIPDLMQLGVESFKIEGRMKSAEYVGSVVAAYRYLMDNWEKDKKGALATAKRLLSTDFARAKTSYWYNFKTNEEGVAKAGSLILNPNQAGGTGIYLGKIDSFGEVSDSDKEKAYSAYQEALASNPEAQLSDFQISMAHLSGGSYDPDIGDSIRLHRQDDSGRASHKVRSVTVDDSGKRFIDVPRGFKRGDSVYLLQTKSMSKRYPHVLPPDIGRYRQQPGAEVLPVLDLTPVARNELSYFPEGLYIQVSTVQDLFQAISKNPVRVIIELNTETKNDLLVKKVTLPLSKKQVIISLDPYCPASKEEQLASDLAQFIEEGYKTFIVNNIAHISMLRSKGVNMIAGPYLYTFNRWAASWLENQQIGAFITPLENSWDNLKMTWEENVRERVLVTAYAYPALFRMRFALPESYDFLYFKDKEETLFKVNSTVDGSVVMPEAPFSIVDKVEILNSDGFKRILLDFSRTKLSRQELKIVTSSMIKKQPIPETSRFNWKNGFYSLEKMEIYKAMNEKAEAEKNAGIKKNTGSRKGERRGNVSAKGRRSSAKKTQRRG
ncbi:MAG: U32 family peptidase [Treponema sp.]|uniref:peptidase U32 family protein n=1 Tax=Treponema sp. TaxID=166 RepID=UPI0025DD4156|nr:peptidase U32 family protein [Treponema sp.]MBQ9282155.1 U32 family peptidase [Treponema sp.]